MALVPGFRFPVAFDDVFPHGVYAMGVEEAPEFNEKTGQRSQARDARAGNERVWQVTGIDRDPQARRKEIKVKVTAPVMPVLPGEIAAGTGMHAVVFDGLTVTPYVDDKSKRMAYSFRATGVSAAQTGASRSPKASASEAA